MVTPRFAAFGTSEPVTIVSTTTTTTADGDSTWVTTERVVPHALVPPRSSQERANPRIPAVLTSLSVYLPGDDPVDADDQLIIRGETYMVDGEPGRWGPLVEVAVKRAGT